MTTDAVDLLTKIRETSKEYRRVLEKKHSYHGITHGVPDKLIMDESFCLQWKKNNCSRGIHLWDEVLSDSDHYLSCDICNLIVNIKNIDTSWVEDDEE